MPNSSVISTVRRMLVIAFTRSYLKSLRLPWRGWKRSTHIEVQQRLSDTRVTFYHDPELSSVCMNVYAGDKFAVAVDLLPREARVVAARLMEFACHVESFDADVDAYFRSHPVDEIPF